MKDKKLREVMRALLDHLNLKETYDYTLVDNYFGNEKLKLVKK